jgi:hypothetical protein
MFDHCFEGIYWPQVIAGGGHVPWKGKTLDLDEYQVDSKLTRYERAGSEAIDGADCEIYDGPARQERLWIEKATGFVKAASRSYVFDWIPNYYSKAIQEIAGRTFADDAEYEEWEKTQPKEVQAKLSAHWAAANWRHSEPGNLSVFSDYREIAPGVHWPMRCERMTVHPQGNGKSGVYQYIRAEIATTDVSKDFSMDELAKSSVLAEGVKVVDRRYDPEIDYVWSKSLDSDEIARKGKAKLDVQNKEKAEEERINNTPINSVADAMKILTDGPKVDPTKVWARAIKYLVDHKEEAFPALVKQLDVETRDHSIRKLAFALRAIGDRRAAPALIRALPRTLLPSASDFGVRLEDVKLCRFMQENDQRGESRGGDMFEYGRAFREVVSALHRLTFQKFNEGDLNFVFLSDSPAQRVQQQAQFHRAAERWAEWWDANWKTMTTDVAYSKVNLPALAAPVVKYAGREKPPAGAGVRLLDGEVGWIVQSAQESKQRCFVDLDTMREGGWPKSLPAASKIGVDSPEVLAWARREGFDMVGVTYTPPGETTPIFCLKPIDMRVWKMTIDEHRNLPNTMAGKEAYELSRPVDLMVPQREVKRPYDVLHSGDSFLFVTREGTAGVIRMTAQVTDADEEGLGAYVAREASDEFRPTGEYRGAKIHVNPMSEVDDSARPAATGAAAGGRKSP